VPIDPKLVWFIYCHDNVIVTGNTLDAALAKCEEHGGEKNIRGKIPDYTEQDCSRP